jgi:putative SOS response-associated peptidase YedK
VTTIANELVASLHDRMPVILNKDDEAIWLDPSIQSPQAIGHVLKPYVARAMSMHEVTKKIGSPSYNNEDAITPIDDDDDPKLV